MERTAPISSAFLPFLSDVARCPLLFSRLPVSAVVVTVLVKTQIHNASLLCVSRFIDGSFNGQKREYNV